MKLTEALYHMSSLERKLDVLGSRITKLSSEERPVTPILKESTSVANRLRDLCSATSWTREQVTYNGLTLGSYIVQRKTMQALLDAVDLSILSPDVFSVYEGIQEEIDSLDLIINSIEDKVDLQVPDVKPPEEKPKEE